MAARQRLGQGLDGVRARVSGLQRQAAAAVAAIVGEKLSSAAVSEEEARKAAADLGERHGLPLLEIIDGSGRVLSSRHWPAGVGLPEGDREVTGSSGLRWETVAEDYGAAERLAVVATRPGTWAGTPVVVRGGFLLDGTMLGELSDLMGAEVALRDTARGRWVARADSPLAKAAPFDPSKGDGTTDVSGTVYRWAAAPLLRAVEHAVPLLGVCLGGQLLAKAAGAHVGPLREREHGFVRVERTPDAEGDPIFGALPRSFDVFSLHEQPSFQELYGAVWNFFKTEIAADRVRPSREAGESST